MSRAWFANAVGNENKLLAQAVDILKEASIMDDHQAVDIFYELNANHGTNLATAAFFEFIKAHKVHGEFIDKVDSSPVNSLQATSDAPHIVIVPGMFAVKKPEIGGDGALLIDIAKSLGLTVSTAPTHDRASLKQNATILHDYLSTRNTDPFWLVSISRGSADVKAMLHQFPNAQYLNHLSQWISVSGILSGTPLTKRINNERANALFLRTLARMGGISTELPAELGENQPHWTYNTDKNTFGVTLVTPISLDWHVTRAVQPRYNRLKHLGPNDGIILLPELLKQRGRIYPIWGADHMLRAPNLSDHFYKLINTLIGMK